MFLLAICFKRARASSFNLSQPRICCPNNLSLVRSRRLSRDNAVPAFDVRVFETFDPGLKNLDHFVPPGFEFFVRGGKTGLGNLQRLRSPSDLGQRSTPRGGTGRRMKPDSMTRNTPESENLSR
jgi:hypothetical protein